MVYRCSVEVQVFKGSCGGIVIQLFSMVSFFASTCPIRSGVGAIDNPDHSGQVFEQYDTSEVPENFLGRLFDGVLSENLHFWSFQGLYKQFF